jgi:hypothetical protein
MAAHCISSTICTSFRSRLPFKQHLHRFQSQKMLAYSSNCRQILNVNHVNLLAIQIDLRRSLRIVFSSTICTSFRSRLPFKQHLHRFSRRKCSPIPQIAARYSMWITFIDGMVVISAKSLAMVCPRFAVGLGDWPRLLQHWYRQNFASNAGNPFFGRWETP